MNENSGHLYSCESPSVWPSLLREDIDYRLVLDLVKGSPHHHSQGTKPSLDELALFLNTPPTPYWYSGYVWLFYLLSSHTCPVFLNSDWQMTHLGKVKASGTRAEWNDDCLFLKRDCCYTRFAKTRKSFRLEFLFSTMRMDIHMRGRQKKTECHSLRLSIWAIFICHWQKYQMTALFLSLYASSTKACF